LQVCVKAKADSKDEIRASNSVIQSLEKPLPKEDSGTQSSLHSFLSPLPETSARNQKSAKFEAKKAKREITLQIYDHKTRRAPSLPSHSDTLPSRLQLMAYRYLLEILLSPTNDMLNSLWAAVGLDPMKKFSPEFRKDINLFYGAEDGGDSFQQADTLQLVSEAWQAVVNIYGFAVEDKLEIVYLNPRSKIFEDSEDVAFQIALEASLRSPSGTALNSIRDLREEDTYTRALIDIATRGSQSVLGTKPFKYSEVFLNAHINRVLEWWAGNRAPVGVDLEDVGRCRSAFYKNLLINITIAL
jgi:hypothetical protein